MNHPQPEAKRMILTERQQKRIATIIEQHVNWMVGWHVTDEERSLNYAAAAKAVAQYIARLKP